MVLADPEGSILTHYVKTGEVRTDAGSWLVEGIGEDFIPEIADLSRVRHAYSISDKESLLTARDLLQHEGIFGGSSSGTLVAAALRYCREQTTPKRVVTFICDSGNKYLSKMFSDLWMAEQGLLERESFRDLRDVISRKHNEGTTVTVAPEDTLLTAYKRMKDNDISQLPVVRGKLIVGMIDESDILLAVRGREERFRSCSVEEIMSDRLVTLSVDDSVDAVYAILEQGMIAIVMDNEEFVGLVTKIDLLNYLKRQI
jgi:cystathionine beta-synthase